MSIMLAAKACVTAIMAELCCNTCSPQRALLTKQLFNPRAVIKRALALHLLSSYVPGSNLPPHAPLSLLCEKVVQIPPAMVLQVVSGDDCWGLLGYPVSSNSVLYLNAATLVARAYEPGEVACHYVRTGDLHMLAGKASSCRFSCQKVAPAVEHDNTMMLCA